MCSTPTKPSRDSLTNWKGKKLSLKGINLKLKLRQISLLIKKRNQLQVKYIY